MANPYILSSYVMANSFYDRDELFSALENTNNRMVWLKGNRQVGKTSFLWSLYTREAIRNKYFPILLDFGACESLEDWTECLRGALSYIVKSEDTYKDIVTNIPDLDHYDFFEIQRLLVEQANKRGLSLLLLCDEAEAWNTIMEKNPRLIQQLRKEWDAIGNIHVLIAATNRLSRLMVNDPLLNSPLLPRLYPIYIAQFSDSAADRLIQQNQNPEGLVDVSPETLKKIKELTGRHPFLIQFLCSKLYQQNERNLRTIDKNDCIVDDYLDRFFQVDFSGLSEDESAILIAIAELENTGQLPTDLDLQQLTHLSINTVKLSLINSENLGLVNRHGSRYAINNYFFHTWLMEKHSKNKAVPKQIGITDGVSDSFKNENKTVPPNKKISILHLSDIHLSNPGIAEIYRIQLETDLTKELNINNLDYLLISGDIAEEAAEIEYKSAEGLVKGIQKRYGLDSKHTIIVPGNHDVNWDLSKAAYKYVYNSGLLPEIQSEKIITAGEEGFLLQNEDAYKKRFSFFSEFFYKGVVGNQYPLEYKDQGIIHCFPNHELMILALNSCWQIDHHNKKRAGIYPDALAF
jgi:predicted phosphodiesterase